MRERYVKEFEVEQGSTENLWYRIRVYFRGQLVEEFLTETMQDAEMKLEQAGYTRSED